MTRLYRKDIRHIRNCFKRINTEKLPVFIVHIETSGLDPCDDEILEVSIIKCRLNLNGLCPEAHFHTYINHGIDIPEEISEYNHITSETLINAPTPIEAVSSIREFIGEDPVILGFSTDFVTGFLKTFCFLYGKEIHPAMEMDVKYMATCCIDKSKIPRFNLSGVLHATGIESDTSDSIHKAESVFKLFNYFYSVFPNGNECASIKKMTMKDFSRRSRYIYIDTDHGKVSVDAISGCLCEETPGFFDIVNLDLLIDHIFSLRNVSTMRDFIRSFA